MTRRTLIPTVLVVVTLTACADPVDPGPGDGGAGGTGTIGHGTQPSDLVLQVGYEGGFTPVEYQLTNFPFFSLYGDGTIVTPGPQIEIYPGPALASIQEQTVNEDGVQAILQAALDAGLGDAGDMTDMGSVMIADAPDTVFTIRTDETERTIRVYALSEMGPDRPQGMSQDEFDARQRLARLVRDLGDLQSWLPATALQGDQTTYEAPGARIYASTDRADGDRAQPPTQWPLDPPLGSLPATDETYGYGCEMVTGSAWTEQLLPVAEQANQSTPWRSGGQRFTVLFRQLLPDEVGTQGC
jgi:hypothetical protein